MGFRGDFAPTITQSKALQGCSHTPPWQVAAGALCQQGLGLAWKQRVHPGDLPRSVRSCACMYVCTRVCVHGWAFPRPQQHVCVHGGGFSKTTAKPQHGTISAQALGRHRGRIKPRGTSAHTYSSSPPHSFSSAFLYSPDVSSWKGRAGAKCQTRLRQGGRSPGCIHPLDPTGQPGLSRMWCTVLSALRQHRCPQARRGRGESRGGKIFFLQHILVSRHSPDGDRMDGGGFWPVVGARMLAQIPGLGCPDWERHKQGYPEISCLALPKLLAGARLPCPRRPGGLAAS